MVLENVITQYAEEAAFLWHLRDLAVCRPQCNLKSLAELDGRIEAHIDGLRIADDAGWEICKEQLSNEGPGEVFAAAVLAHERKNKVGIQAVLEMAIGSPPLARGFISAMGWIPYEQVAEQIQVLLRMEIPAMRRLGMAASAIHRKDPGSALAQSLSSDDSPLRASALKTVGELGRKDLLRQVWHYLKDEDGGCRFAAARSAALLGERSSVGVLRAFSTSPGWGERAVRLGMRVVDLSTAHEWQRELGSDPKTQRLGIIAAGQIGDPIFVPWLIELMTTVPQARIAGEAFTFITGVDFEKANVEGKKPEGFEAGPTDDPEDENVEMEADEDLPWPNPELIQKWWQKNQSRFQKGTRYLMGQPITMESLQAILRTGRQRQRAAAALELTLRQPGRPLFEVRAPGFRQKRLLM